MAYQAGKITGSFLRFDGTAARGRVRVTPAAPVVRDQDGKVILSGILRADLDVDGKLEVNVPASDDVTLDPSGVTFAVAVETDGAKAQTWTGVFVPGNGTVDLADVGSLDPLAPSYQEWVNEAEQAAAAAAGSATAAASSASSASSSAAAAEGSAVAAAGSESAAGASAVAAAASASEAAASAVSAQSSEDDAEAAASAAAASAVAADGSADAAAASAAEAAATLASKAPLASPVFTGNPTAPTPATSDNDTSIATTAYVKAQQGVAQILSGDVTLTGSIVKRSTSAGTAALKTDAPVGSQSQFEAMTGGAQRAAFGVVGASGNERMWIYSYSRGKALLDQVAGTDEIDFAGPIRTGGSAGPLYTQGTGSPESVVTAPVGSRYVDTAATNGAVEWIKASGAGSTGWRVVFGDTGWIAIPTANYQANCSPAAVGYIRRVNHLIHIHAEVATTASYVSGTDAILLPSWALPRTAYMTDGYAGQQWWISGLSLRFSGNGVNLARRTGMAAYFPATEAWPLGALI